VFGLDDTDFDFLCILSAVCGRDGDETLSSPLVILLNRSSDIPKTANDLA